MPKHKAPYPTPVLFLDNFSSWEAFSIHPLQVRALTEEVVHTVLHHAHLPTTHTVNVRYTDDQEIRILNRTFRQIDRATDVLSFPMQEWVIPKKNFCVGDLVISLETAARNAKRYRTPLLRELVRLLIHGALHLLGYDHHEKKERAIMRAQEKLIAKLIFSAE